MNNEPKEYPPMTWAQAQWLVNDLVRITGIGATVAAQTVLWFANPKNRQVLAKLELALPQLWRKNGKP